MPVAKVVSILGIAALVLAGCASVEKQNSATTAEHGGSGKKLEISYEINRSLTSEYFGMVEFTFSNKTDHWLEIRNIELKIPDDDLRNTVVLTTGRDFENWRYAARKRLAIENHNQQAFFGSLALVASVATISGNRQTSAMGAGALVATGTSYAISELAKSRNQAQGNALFPRGHLLHNPERIPPGMFVDKWLLLDTSNVTAKKILTTMDMLVSYADDTSDTYTVQIYQWDTKAWHYGWQKNKLK